MLLVVVLLLWCQEMCQELSKCSLEPIALLEIAIMVSVVNFVVFSPSVLDLVAIGNLIGQVFLVLLM